MVDDHVLGGEPRAVPVVDTTRPWVGLDAHWMIFVSQQAQERVRSHTNQQRVLRCHVHHMTGGHLAKVLARTQDIQDGEGLDSVQDDDDDQD